MRDYEDYYEEPSEFEQQIDEFKTSLYNSVKEEHKLEMDKLIKENNELQEIKRNFNKIESEYKQKQRELERKIESAERDAKRLRLTELMQELKQSLWQKSRTSVYEKKCDKCDNARKIHFTSPSGKDMTEDCKCAKNIIKYEPCEYELYSFQQNKDEIGKWYKKKYEDEDYYTEDGDRMKLLVKSEEDFQFVNNNTYGIFFISKELCQKYCDIKNNENGITEDMAEEK